MSTHPVKMVKIWDKRIETLRERIRRLRGNGFNRNDEELREVYERLKFFEECRKHSLAEIAWEEK